MRPIGDWSMAIILSRCSRPSIRSWAPGSPFAAVQVAPQGLDQDVVDQRTLAGAGDAGHADERAQRNLDVDVLEVVVRRAANDAAAGSPSWSPLLGHLDLLACPTGTAPVTLFGSAMTSLGRCRRPPPRRRARRARAEVDDVVGRPHRVFVVLDDDHRVALVAQLAERLQQPVVVAGVQADRRFVEDVEHADQPAADLAGQADPLHLAAGERRGGAVERQVVEPHVAAGSRAGRGSP